MKLFEKVKTKKNQCFRQGDFDEMVKPKNISKRAKSHFKRKPYSKDKLIIN